MGSEFQLKRIAREGSSMICRDNVELPLSLLFLFLSLERQLLVEAVSRMKAQAWQGLRFADQDQAHYDDVKARRAAP